jgi:hypothetical protein
MIAIRSLLVFLIFAVSSVAAGSNAEGLAFLTTKKGEDGVVALPSGLL